MRRILRGHADLDAVMLSVAARVAKDGGHVDWPLLEDLVRFATEMKRALNGLVRRGFVGHCAISRKETA
jgi:hypothetical protein